MAWTITRREALLYGAASAITVACGCGTILHPERRGQPAGRLDWGVVLLDGIGLLFFFVPGVIAFAVDFATGAIYLPPEDCIGDIPRAANEHGLVSVRIPRTSMSRDAIAGVVSRTTGRSVCLSADECHAVEMQTLADFSQLRARAYEG